MFLAVPLVFEKMYSKILVGIEKEDNMDIVSKMAKKKVKKNGE